MGLKCFQRELQGCMPTQFDNNTKSTVFIDASSSVWLLLLFQSCVITSNLFVPCVLSSASQSCSLRSMFPSTVSFQVRYSSTKSLSFPLKSSIISMTFSARLLPSSNTSAFPCSRRHLASNSEHFTVDIFTCLVFRRRVLVAFLSEHAQLLPIFLP